jgi:hypothetical protein
MGYHLSAVDQEPVVHKQRTAFSAGKILLVVEAEYGEIADATQRPTFVPGEEPMGDIFDQSDPTFATHPKNWIEIR